MATVRLGRMTGKAMVLTGSTTEAAQAEEMNVTEKGTKKRAHFLAFFCPVNSKSGFFGHSEKKLKVKKTQNSRKKPKTQAQNSESRHFFRIPIEFLLKTGATD